MRDNTGKPIALPLTSHVGPDGGGFCTSIAMTDDGGVMVHGTDVGNGYVRANTERSWRRVMTFDTYPDIGTLNPPSGYSDSAGVYAIAIAPSNGQIGYLLYSGALFRTTNQFSALTRIGTSYYKAPANSGAARLYNDKMVIDPIDPNIVVFGTRGGGAFYYINGTTANPVKITGMTDTADLPPLIAVDRSSATTNGHKSGWYIYVAGQGLFKSTTGPDGSFSLVSGSPTVEVGQMVVSTTGIVYLTDVVGNRLIKYQSGTWSNEFTNFNSPLSFALGKDGRGVSINNNSYFLFTNKNDGTWSPTFQDNYPLDNGMIYVCKEARWLDHPYRARLFGSKILADPVVSGKYWLAHGTGVCWFTLPDSWGSTPITFNDYIKGNSMLVTMKAESQKTSGRILRTAWDKPVFVGITNTELDNPTHYSPQYVGVEIGSDIDWDPQNENHLFALVNQFTQQSGDSLDGGETWTRLANHHPDNAMGGSWCWVSGTEGYWFPAQNGRAVYTTDKGQTAWKYLSMTAIDGTTIPTSGESGWSFGYYFNKKNSISSKEELGVAYAYNYGPSGKEGLRGIWRKEAGSTTWTQVFAGLMPNASSFDYCYHMRLAEMWGHAGYLLISSGGDQAQAYFHRSVNRGNSWSIITTSVNGGTAVPIRQVSSFGFGKNLPGTRYPAIRYAGVVGGVYGIWETLDNFVTSVFIEARPMGINENVTGIAGSSIEFGKWVYGIGQQGWVRSNRTYRLTIT